MSTKKDKGAPTGAPMSRKERRAAERAARGKKGTSTKASSDLRSNRPLITAAAIIIGVVLVVVVALAVGGFGGSSMAPVSASDVPPPPQDLRVGRSLGDPDAPVKIDAFEDAQCPSCGNFTEFIEPFIIAGPVKDGQVFFTYKDMAFLGQESIDAAAAMRVAEAMDGKFWDFHDILFHNQNPQNLENRGDFSRARLADMAELIGLDRDTFLAEMDDSKYAQAVLAEKAEGEALGVNSTPTLIINGELIRGAPPWDELKGIIARAAAAAETDTSPEEAVASDAPDREATTTDAPATEPPATGAPAPDATDAPATEAPATAAPATDAPATEAPAPDAMDAPATETPATETPAPGATDAA